MERDYVLGTHEEEVERLGLQHRVWRPLALECWQRAGVTVGKRVLDIGAGPGYAAVDFAEIVGPHGAVVAVERSHNFVQVLQDRARSRGLTNIHVHELDLMVDELPSGIYDFSWCRWVAAFVSDPALLIGKLADVLPAGAVAMFHEYGQYDTWRYNPPLPHHRQFRDLVVQTWVESGGQPDAAPVVLQLLRSSRFTICAVRPLIFCVGPDHYMWQWAAEFVDNYLPRLKAMGRIDQAFVDKLTGELAHAANDSECVMTTPLVWEIVAQRT